MSSIRQCKKASDLMFGRSGTFFLAFLLAASSQLLAETQQETENQNGESASDSSLYSTYQYAVKFVCGMQDDEWGTSLVQGYYGSAINIINLNEHDVSLSRVSVIFTHPQREEFDSYLSGSSLEAGQAIEIDCDDVAINLEEEYAKGFIVIEADGSLDITGVYTGTGIEGSGWWWRNWEPSGDVSIDVEEVSERILEPTPVYVTVAGHIEDLPPYSEDCPDGGIYADNRAQLLEFAEVVRAGGFDFNLQASYEWFLAVSNCETTDLMALTDGLNIMDYLVREYDFEIDVHQGGAATPGGEHGNNFADIRYLGGTVTAHLSETTGFQWNTASQYDSLQNGEQGLLHTSFNWLPEILAGGVSDVHIDEDFSADMTSIGGWIPSGFSDLEFHVHDTSADARMFYVGSGPNQHMADWQDPADKEYCNFNNTADFVSVVAQKISDGTFDSGELYTTTLFVPQSIIFSPGRYAELEAVIADMAPLVASGHVVYAHFTEVEEHWRRDYASRPNIVEYDRFDRTDYTCPCNPANYTCPW